MASLREVRLGAMAPPSQALSYNFASPKLRSDARPTPQWRAELRHISNVRNALTIAALYAQTLAILWLAIRLQNMIAYAAAFVLMGRAHAQFASLMHESAHRLLFTSKFANDFAGRWLLGFPGFVTTDGYRFVHSAHHRQEFGPDEPDLALYANYPITRRSFRRKLVRDALGITGVRLMRNQLQTLFAGERRSRTTQIKIFGLQVSMFAVSWIIGHPFIYLLLWLLPFLTIWRVINRLRSIAEHGGMRQDEDRRMTTHSVRQSWLARFFIVPYNIGWHLAHHVDSGIPFRSLPKYHAELRANSYVAETFEYRSYLAIWRALRAR